jgi:hypothetical protein
VACRPAAGQVPAVFAEVAAPPAVAAEHCAAFIEHAAPAVAGQLEAADVLIMPAAPRAEALCAEALCVEAPCAMAKRTTPTTNRLMITAPAATFFIRVFMMHTSFRN